MLGDILNNMSLEEIKTAITQLSPQETAELMSWITAHSAQIWDKQIEDDLEAGRLDTLLSEVDKEHKASHCL